MSRAWRHADFATPREQALFLIGSSGLDAEPAFLVPRREVADSVEYEAVFNQTVDTGSGS
jgi:hypothetical protein